jgi:predicted cupin superfamily sugar epimerase
MTADEVRKLLNLTPAATCGYVRVTYMADLKVPEGALVAPFGAARPAGSALYFMVTPDEPVKLHRIMNDQLYHYYLGDALEVLLLRNGGERVIVGPDLAGGQVVQLLIPGGTFHTARVIGTRNWFLGASTEWPGVIPTDVELGDAAKLAAMFPKVAAEIAAFPKPA